MSKNCTVFPNARTEDGLLKKNRLSQNGSFSRLHEGESNGDISSRMGNGKNNTRRVLNSSESWSLTPAVGYRHSIHRTIISKCLFVFVSLLLTAWPISASADDLSSKIIESYGDPIETIEDIDPDTWYLIHIADRTENSGYIYNYNNTIRFFNSATAPALGADASQYSTYLFKVNVTSLSAYDSSVITLQCGNGLYVQGGRGGLFTTTSSETLDIMYIEDTYFYLYNKSRGRLYYAGNHEDEIKYYMSTTPGSQTAGNEEIQFIPVILDEAINVTCNYYLDGEKVKSESISSKVGVETTSIVTLPDFVEMTSCSPQMIEETTTEITINCTSHLPFTPSESFDNAVWYAIDFYNDKETDHTWCWQEDYGITTPVVSKSSIKPLSDSYLWCFVGNVFDGFRIYNKSAGSSKNLYGWYGSTSLSTSTTDNIYKAYEALEFEGAVDFMNATTGYFLGLKTSNLLEFGDYIYRGNEYAYTACQFFSPGSYVLNAAEDYLQFISRPDDVLGYSNYLKENGTDALSSSYQALSEDPFDLDLTQGLSDVLSAIKKAGYIDTSIDTNKYYRLINKMDGNYLTYYTRGSKNVMCNETEGNAATSVVQFVSTGTEGQYYVKMDGQTFGQITEAESVVLLDATSTETESPAVVEISNNGIFFLLKDVSENTSANADYRYLYTDESDAIGWSTTETDGVYWMIQPATNIEVTLHALGDNTYGTIYLPFAVTLPEGVTAYAGSLTANESYVKVNEVAGTLPAENGYILEGNENTAVLTIADADAETAIIENNDITGSYSSKACADNYRIFSGSTGKLGFYISDSETLAANKAYIVLTEAQSASAQGLILDFGGVVDAIKDIDMQGAPTESTIYDLSGRSVKKASKGLYIQNGKPVYIK